MCMFDSYHLFFHYPTQNRCPDSQMYTLFLPLLPLLLLPFLLLSTKFKNKNGDNNPNLPPGPRKLPIIGNLLQIGDFPHRSLLELSKKHGPIMLLELAGKPTLIISSAEMAKQVLKTHDVDFCSRHAFSSTKRFSYDFKDFAFAPYGEYWKEMRKFCVVELLSVKRVQSFAFVRKEEVASLIKSISNDSQPNSVINLTENLFFVTDRIISRIAFGKSYQGREMDIGGFREDLYEAMAMLGKPAAADFFQYFGWIVDVYTGYNRKLDKSFNALDTFYQKVIDDHSDPQREKPEQEDIIDVLLRSQTDHQYGSTRLSNTHVKAILMDIFLPGIDTSASTMVWAMTELARNPEVMNKVQTEIRKQVGNKGSVEESDIKQLEYFKMVVKETLRLHPPTTLVPRESINQCKINGYDIFPKTSVLVNAWAIGTSSQYWENPKEFCPDRFRNNSIDFVGQDFEFIPFGSGRRVCPGINMAVSTIEMVLANILYCFNWELPSGTSKEDINMDETAGTSVKKKFPLQLVPIKYVS